MNHESQEIPAEVVFEARGAGGRRALAAARAMRPGLDSPGSNGHAHARSHVDPYPHTHSNADGNPNRHPNPNAHPDADRNAHARPPAHHRAFAGFASNDLDGGRAR